MERTILLFIYTAACEALRRKDFDAKTREARARHKLSPRDSEFVYRTRFAAWRTKLGKDLE